MDWLGYLWDFGLLFRVSLNQKTNLTMTRPVIIYLQCIKRKYEILKYFYKSSEMFIFNVFITVASPRIHQKYNQGPEYTRQNHNYFLSPKRCDFGLFQFKAKKSWFFDLYKKSDFFGKNIICLNPAGSASSLVNILW